jgi:hypothetical protein
VAGPELVVAPAASDQACTRLIAVVLVVDLGTFARVYTSLAAVVLVVDLGTFARAYTSLAAVVLVDQETVALA